MTVYREATRQDRLKAYSYLGLYLAGIMAAALLIDIDRSEGFGAWLAIAFAGVFVLAWWNARHTGYRCQHCGHEFEVSMWTELVTFQGMGGGGWKYVKCPQCDRRSRAKVLARE